MLVQKHFWKIIPIFTYLFTNSRTYDRVRFPEGPLAIKNNQNFSPSKRTIFYFPGWGEKPNNDIESVNLITDAYMKKGNLNVIVFDYSVVVKSDGENSIKTNLNYLKSKVNVTFIGIHIGNFLKNYSQSVQNDNMFQLVGHSMGAQIISYAAKKYGKGKLRLTGLDPAYPLFNLPLLRMEARDGSFVDIIHTDLGRYGQFKSLGHADFFPNDGKRIQPYCLNSSHPDSGDYCSHHMSWRYYAESINNEKGFQAIGCTDKAICTPIDPNSCKCNTYNSFIAHMGYGVDTSIRGNFYLRTNAESPFAKGSEGLRSVLP